MLIITSFLLLVCREVVVPYYVAYILIFSRILINIICLNDYPYLENKMNKMISHITRSTTHLILKYRSIDRFIESYMILCSHIDDRLC